MNINRPRVDIDCCYPVTDPFTSEEKPFVESPVCRNARINPNFDNPIVLFDVVSMCCDITINQSNC